MRKGFLILLVFLIALTSCQGKKSRHNEKEILVFADSIDIAIFNSIREISKSNSLDSLILQNRVIEVAKIFLQTPYASGTLESQGKEKLVVNLRELDCTTYLENIIALSSILGKKNFSENDFLKELEHLRYRNGKLTDYTSRLHYFTDWIYENEQKGVLKNITSGIGGEKYNKTINFMSTHVDSYAALEADSSFVKIIQATEDSINKREVYYIPEKKIQGVEKEIRNGDLIAITTNIKGLDVSHVGIAIHISNRLHLMHASSLAKKVVISDVPLAEMLWENKLQSGIMVARLQ